jgi:hypothetical protein
MLFKGKPTTSDWKNANKNVAVITHMSDNTQKNAI